MMILKSLISAEAVDGVIGVDDAGDGFLLLLLLLCSAMSANGCGDGEDPKKVGSSVWTNGVYERMRFSEWKEKDRKKMGPP